jgi:nucleoside-diphosphate-sugar epimerase
MDDRMNIFVAGATGVIGRPLVALLVRAGHSVTGTTRSADRAGGIAAAGAEPVVVDVFDAAELMNAVVTARPQVIIHQLTDLPDQLDPKAMETALDRNARLRIDGTRNLMAAAAAAGVARVVAQSIAFAYAEGPKPLRETDPLDVKAAGARLRTVGGVVGLESAVLGTPAVVGIVLRYGRLYGPGTWFSAPEGAGPLHADAAAHAALLAVTSGSAGIYNIAEDDGAVSIEKAKRELGFNPAFRLDS